MQINLYICTRYTLLTKSETEKLLRIQLIADEKRGKYTLNLQFMATGCEKLADAVGIVLTKPT